MPGHPAGLPELLRAAGLRLRTLAEVYGIPADETIPDVDRLAYLAVLDQLTAACAEPGPFLFTVSRVGLRRIDLDN